MRLSGCETLGLGLESVDQATLDAFHKSQSVADIVTAVDASTRTASGCTVCSSSAPTRTTADTMRHTVDFAIQHRIDTVMLNMLTPAPGTDWFAEVDAEGRIFDKCWQLYDGQHVVITPHAYGALRAPGRGAGGVRALLFAAAVAQVPGRAALAQPPRPHLVPVVRPPLGAKPTQSRVPERTEATLARHSGTWRESALGRALRPSEGPPQAKRPPHLDASACVRAACASQGDHEQVVLQAAGESDGGGLHFPCQLLHGGSV